MDTSLTSIYINHVMNKTVVNLTPHDVNLYVNNNKVVTYPAKYNKDQQHLIPRCEPQSVQVGYLNNTIPMYQTVYGEVNNLPAQTENTVLIVSALVRTKHPERKDLISPHGLVRDDKQRVIGCTGFDTNLD